MNFPSRGKGEKLVDLHSVDEGLEEEPIEYTILRSERPETRQGEKDVCDNEGTRIIVRIQK